MEKLNLGIRKIGWSIPSTDGLNPEQRHVMTPQDCWDSTTNRGIDTNTIIRPRIGDTKDSIVSS